MMKLLLVGFGLGRVTLGSWSIVGFYGCLDDNLMTPS